MGCGNSSAAKNNNNNNINNSSSSNEGGRAESSAKESEESLTDDDKRKNYGGVYVGLPTNLSNVPQVQIGSLRESSRDSSSLRTPLWGNGL